MPPLTSPYQLNDATLSVAEDDFTEAIGGVECVPSASPASWTGIGGNTRQSVPPATWVCNINFAQDLDPAGFLRYLLDNEGQTKVITFTPKAGGPSIEVEVTITPGTIGGQAGTAPLVTSSVSLPCNGKPEFTDPTP